MSLLLSSSRPAVSNSLCKLRCEGPPGKQAGEVCSTDLLVSNLTKNLRISLGWLRTSKPLMVG
jgi:hypothetical protein